MRGHYRERNASLDQHSMEDPTLEVAGVRGLMRFIEPGGATVMYEEGTAMTTGKAERMSTYPLGSLM